MTEIEETLQTGDLAANAEAVVVIAEAATEGVALIAEAETEEEDVEIEEEDVEIEVIAVTDFQRTRKRLRRYSTSS